MAWDLDRAVAQLGPLEGRVMRLVWTGTAPATLVVRDMNGRAWSVRRSRYGCSGS